MSWSWQLDQIKDYLESLKDYIFWQNRQYYRENLQKFVARELTVDQFVNQVLYPILSDQREGRDLEVNFYEQAKVDLDPKSFGFSKIIWDLPFILENCDYASEDDASALGYEE